MQLNDTLARVTDRIIARSEGPRAAYLARMRAARDKGPARAHLSCSNQAHAYAAAGADQDALATGTAGNLGIVTAYNDMLSAHQPFERYPDLIREAARAAGGTAQVAGGVPAICDGVTQGEVGMELSLFSRDVIALAAAVALSSRAVCSAASETRTCWAARACFSRMRTASIVPPSACNSESSSRAIARALNFSASASPADKPF